MNARHIRWSGMGVALAIVGAVAGIGCRTPSAGPGTTAAKYMFFVHFTNGCPDGGKNSEGPPGLEQQWHCPGQTPAQCMRLPHGERLRFQGIPASKDFTIHFQGASPYGGPTDIPTQNGNFEDRTTGTAGDPPETFTFTVSKDGCPPVVDPQIILN